MFKVKGFEEHKYVHFIHGIHLILIEAADHIGSLKDDNRDEID